MWRDAEGWMRNIRRDTLECEISRRRSFGCVFLLYKVFGGAVRTGEEVSSKKYYTTRIVNYIGELWDFWEFR